MKVYIGPYKNWWGPYQLADLLQKMGVSKDKCHSIGEWLADTFVMKVCQWIDSHRERSTKIRIDDYDAWNVDCTLSPIIHPLLLRLKLHQHGHANVDDEDVPEELRSYNAPPYDKDREWDAFSGKRWDWVLDEMIWTFAQLKDDGWENQYHTGEIDIQFVPCDDSDDLQEMVKGPKDTHVFDMEGWKRHNDRINNGCCLFGKYFRALWD